MNEISKIIADKILYNTLDECSEKVFQEWLELNPENRATFEQAKGGELATIILSKESENLGKTMSQKVSIQIHQEKKRNRNRLKIIMSSVAAIIAVLFLIYFDKEELIIIKIDDPIAENKQEVVNDEIMLITADGNQVNIKKSEVLDSIMKQQSGSVKLTPIKTAIADNTIIIPLKKVFNMVLPDGTKVWLNSGSKLIFPAQFSDSLRRVELIGEAFFEVVKNPNAPFIVKTKTLETKVLGTKFMVTSYEDNSNSEVALVEGRVNVSSSTANRSSILKPGKGVSYDSNNNNYKVMDINIDNILNRKNELFVFNDTSLSDITTSLSRWYGVEFEFSDQAIQNELFYLKSIKYDDINEIMLLLKDTKKIDYTIENNKIKIKSSMLM